MAKNYTPFDPDSIGVKKDQQVDFISKPKEAEPAAATPEKYEIKEVVEHEPSEEVKPFVQPKPETIKLPPDLKKIGLQPVTTTQFPTYQNVKLPISDDKVVSGLHAPITSALRWLATLAIYILRQAHLTLKVVGGRVIRVIKR